MWKKFNSVLDRSSWPTCIEGLISCGVYLNGIPLASAFNYYFTNVTNCATTIARAYDAAEFRNNNSLSVGPVTESKIMSVFLGLRKGNSCDMDDNEIRPMEYVINLLLSHLARIFNLCILHASFLGSADSDFSDQREYEANGSFVRVQSERFAAVNIDGRETLALRKKKEVHDKV